MPSVEQALQTLGGREITSIFDENVTVLQIGIVMTGLEKTTAMFLAEGKLNTDEQLMLAMYGMSERRYFAIPAKLDKYSFVPQLQLALLRDTDKVWGTMPEI